MFRISASSPHRSVHVGGKAQSVAVRVTQEHLAAAPSGVVRWLLDRYVGGTEGAVQGVDVFNDEVHRAADLAVAAVFGEEDRLAVAGELGEQREAGFEAVLRGDSKP